MPVFDFSNATTEKKDPECTYTTFRSNETKPSPEKPILVLDNTSRQWNHHSCGVFSNPNQKSSFEFNRENNMPSLAYQTTVAALTALGARPEVDYRLQVAAPEQEGGCLVL